MKLRECLKLLEEGKVLKSISREFYVKGFYPHIPMSMELSDDKCRSYYEKFDRYNVVTSLDGKNYDKTVYGINFIGNLEDDFQIFEEKEEREDNKKFYDNSPGKIDESYNIRQCLVIDGGNT